jgi:hypothetical protein
MIIELLTANAVELKFKKEKDPPRSPLHDGSFYSVVSSLANDQTLKNFFNNPAPAGRLFLSILFQTLRRL